MVSFKNLNILKSKKVIIIIVLIAIFTGAAIFVYNKYVASKLNPKYVTNREFTKDATTVHNATLYFIYATWCPHSKKVIGHWEKLKERYDYKNIKRPVNTYAVRFVQYDGDKDEEKIEQFTKQYNKKIDGYPTIILVKDNEVIEFEAEPSIENLEEFIKTTL